MYVFKTREFSTVSKYRNAGIGAGAGAILGAGAGALSLRGLKGKLKEQNPGWSDEQVQKEYNKIRAKRLAGGALGGAVVGGAAGHFGSKMKMPSFKSKKTIAAEAEKAERVAKGNKIAEAKAKNEELGTRFHKIKDKKYRKEQLKAAQDRKKEAGYGSQNMTKEFKGTMKDRLKIEKAIKSGKNIQGLDVEATKKLRASNPKIGRGSYVNDKGHTVKMHSDFYNY